MFDLLGAKNETQRLSLFLVLNSAGCSHVCAKESGLLTQHASKSTRLHFCHLTRYCFATTTCLVLVNTNSWSRVRVNTVSRLGRVMRRQHTESCKSDIPSGPIIFHVVGEGLVGGGGLKCRNPEYEFGRKRSPAPKKRFAKIEMFSCLVFFSRSLSWTGGLHELGGGISTVS